MTTLIAVTIIVLIDVAITDVLTRIRIVLQSAPTTIVTVVPTIIVTKIVTSIRPHSTSLTIAVIVPRATTATHALTVAHAVMTCLLVPLPVAIFRNLLREVLEDLARPEAVPLVPNMIIYLLNVGE